MFWGKAASAVLFTRPEQEAGILRNDLVLRETKLWNPEVGIRIVDRYSGEDSPDSVFAIVVVAVGLRSALLGDSVWLLYDRFVHDDKTRFGPGLTRLSQISPEPSSVCPPASSNIVVASGFVSDNGVARLHCGVIECGCREMPSAASAGISRGRTRGKEQRSKSCNQSANKRVRRESGTSRVVFHMGILTNVRQAKRDNNTFSRLNSKTRNFLDSFAKLRKPSHHKVASSPVWSRAGSSPVSKTKAVICSRSR